MIGEVGSRLIREQICQHGLLLFVVLGVWMR
jgi:hypothetical protein